MGSYKYFDNMIESKLMSLHTAYLAKVISVSGSTAKIQPLGYVKAYGETAQKQSPLSAVPIVESAMYKLEVKQETVLTSASLVGESLSTTKKTINTVEKKPIKAGDVVICLCCERDISNAKKGANTTPAVNSRHSMSNSVIVGIL